MSNLIFHGFNPEIVPRLLVLRTDPESTEHWSPFFSANATRMNSVCFLEWLLHPTKVPQGKGQGTILAPPKDSHYELGLAFASISTQSFFLIADITAEVSTVSQIKE
jgi:hypothetical protein